MFNTRIRVAETATAGSLVEIRAMIMHQMDNGYTYTTSGELVPVDIIEDFTCTYLDQEVIHVRLEPGISANPIFTFDLRATESGMVKFRWVDQHGVVTEAESWLEVT